MQAKVYNQSGESMGTIELNSRIFGVEINPAVVHQTVVSLMSSSRSPVASTKTRGEVRGGGKKPHQQKGTGRARAGSIRSPLWRGGGITFGPRANRNFARKINKKEKLQTLFSVLTDKLAAGQLAVIDSLEQASPKTRELALKVKDLRAKIPGIGRNIMMIISDGQKNLIRAGRNLPDVNVALAGSLNILELLYAQGVIITKDALETIEKTYLNPSTRLRAGNKGDKGN